jgi:glycerol-3-phosphate dehydrogenase subunit B
MRVFQTLRDRLRTQSGRIILNSEAVGAAATGARVETVRATAAGRELTYTAKWIVLATGGIASGGLALDSRWEAREKVFGLPLAGAVEPDAERFSPRYFDDHPFNAVGVAVDDGLRPVAPAGGERVYENVLVAGATVAGARPWKEKSGEGISLATGHRAAEIILEEDR